MKVCTIDSLKNLRCWADINALKQRIEKQYGIQKNCEYYIEVSKDGINELLFPLFGDSQCLNSEKYKSVYEKINPQTKEKLELLFKKTFRNQKSFQWKQGQFVNHIRNNIETLLIHQNMIMFQRNIWNEIGPEVLSVKKQMNHVYFKLPNYGVQSAKKQNKNVLVVDFNETDDTKILCFFETQRYFSKKQIDNIFKDIFPQRQNNISPQKSFQAQSPLKSPSSSNKKQAINQGSLQSQQFDLMPRQKQLKVIRGEQLWSHVTSFIYIILITIFVMFALQTRQGINSQSDLDAIESYNLSQIQKQMIAYKKIVQSQIIEPLSNLPMLQTFDENLRPISVDLVQQIKQSSFAKNATQVIIKDYQTMKQVLKQDIRQFKNATINALGFLIGKTADSQI